MLVEPLSIKSLPPVTVTTTLYGSKEAVLLGDSAASVGVTTAEDIQNSQLRSFRDSFRRLGNVMDGDWTDAGFIIRGVSSEGFVPGGAPVGALMGRSAMPVEAIAELWRRLEKVMAK